MNEEFWNIADSLVAQSEIVIDRPKGSTHPRYSEIVYETDYGYLKDTRFPDGAGIDVWVGSGERKVTAVICTIDSIKRDSEIKLLIGCTDEETRYIGEFHNRTEFMKGITIRR